MRKLETVLVVDGSRVARELLARLMKPRARATHAIDDCEKAREWIAGNAELSLVIADLDAPGGGALRLLEFAAGMGERRPHLLVIGRRVSEEQRTQSELLGAIGCVTKPIRFQEISRAIRASEEPSFVPAPPRVRATPPARAHLLDADGQDSHIVWNVHDISINGALLDTRGPLPLRAELSLALAIDGGRIPVRAEVVRVQEPAWDTLPGVAVQFRGLPRVVRARLETYVRRCGGTP